MYGFVQGYQYDIFPWLITFWEPLTHCMRPSQLDTVLGKKIVILRIKNNYFLNIALIHIISLNVNNISHIHSSTIMHEVSHLVF